MKTTQELYDLDPRQFKGMLYEDVLALKRIQAERIAGDAHTESFKIGFYPLSVADKARVKELQGISAEAEKAIKYIRMWQNELE